MSSSALVTYRIESPNCSIRTQKITKITVHHAACVASAKAIANTFASPARKASANYCIGNDGSIAQALSENKRAWTSSSAWNDQRAVTIEVSNSKAADPWPISEKAYQALVKLCADICERNGIKTLHYDGTKDGSLTEHRMYAATLCPGQTIHGYLVSGRLEKDINAVLAGKPSAVANEKSLVVENMDYSLVFDPAYYCGKYADLKKAFGDDAAKLFTHFRAYGMDEARIANADFDVTKYRAKYTDLDAAFGANWRMYYLHYMTCGAKEITEGKRQDFRH